VSGVGEKYGLPSPYDLDDEMVKLVAYTIVSIQRDRERVMKRGAGTVVVTESMTPEAFSAWRISEYLASDEYEELDEKDKLGPSEEKYLRVDYVVSRRWPRQSRGFERRQLAVLDEIREALEEDGRPGDTRPQPPTAAGGRERSNG
jgi:hypothetical protein